MKRLNLDDEVSGVTYPLRITGVQKSNTVQFSQRGVSLWLAKSDIPALIEWLEAVRKEYEEKEK